jgi:separase
MQYTAALQEIAAARTSLLSWWRPGVAPERAPVATRPLNQHAANLIVPLPLPVYLEPPSLAETLNSSNARPALADFAPLVLTLQQYLLACLFRCPTFACRERTGELAHVVRQLEGEGGPLAWRNLMGERDLGEVMPPDSTEDAAEAERRIFLRKKVDASLTSMFGIVTKGCAGADTEAGTASSRLLAILHPLWRLKRADLSTPDPTDAQDLLDVRIHALELYATTSALVPGALDKLSAFFDQVRKTLLLYGRSAEKAASSPVKISEAVRGAFDRILEALEKRGLLGQEAKSSERWRELCEVVLHIARRVSHSRGRFERSL